MFSHYLIGVCVVALCTKMAYGRICNAGDEVGNINAANMIDGNTGVIGIVCLPAYNPDVTYIINDPTYDSPCCGVIDKFRARLRGGTVGDSITWQVWAPEPFGQTNNWRLVGQETFSTTTTNGDQDFPFTSRVSVDDGYRFGWYTPGAQVVGYKTGGSLQADTKFISPSGAWAVDQEKDWSTVTMDVYDNVRDYPFEVHFENGALPTFTTTNNAATISDTEAANTDVLTAIALDSDIGDIVSYSIDATCDNEFQINATTGQITVDPAGLTTVNGTVACQVTATDICGNAAGPSQNPIHIINPPPVWTGNFATFKSEDLAVVDHAFNITITDNGPTTCDVTPGETGPFIVQPTAFGLDGLIITSPANFDFSTQHTYYVPVVCNDGTTTMTRTYSIYLEQNWTPWFLNLQNSTIITSFWNISDDVFCVEAFDKEGDNLNFTLSCEPFIPVCPFYIVDSGCVKLNMHLTNVTDLRAGYDVFITVMDAKNTAAPATLTINIADMNTAVICQYLPNSVAVAENNTIGDTIYVASYFDVDIGQAHTWMLTANPASTYFVIDDNGNVNLTAIVDYEDVANTANGWTYNLTLTAADFSTSCFGFLIVEFLNVNEPPVFASPIYGIPATEPAAGTALMLPVWGVTDVDSIHTAQNLQYTLSCPTHGQYFSMALATGEITMALDWDLDDPALPTVMTCQVIVTDAGGLYDNATVIISFTDLNDNVPFFAAPFYEFFISYYLLTGDNVGDVIAIDYDLGLFGNLTYSLMQNTVNGTNQFSMYQNGTIYLTTAPIQYGSVHYLTLTASDIGSQTATVNVTVYIGGTTTGSPYTTTYKYKHFLEFPHNWWWLAILILVLLSSCIFSTWLCCTCRGPQGCLAFWHNLRNRHKPIQYQRKPKNAKRSQNTSTESTQRRSVRPYPPGKRTWQTESSSQM